MKDEIVFLMWLQSGGDYAGPKAFWYMAFKAYGEFGVDVARQYN